MEIVKKAIGGNDILRVLRIKPFFYMMISEFFSQLAFNMQNFILILIVYSLTHSNTAVSGIILSFTIPAILFSIISGVYVDRWSKKRVLFLANLIRGLLLLPFLIPGLHVGFMYILTFLIAVATQFFLPAESSIIPFLVPKNLIIAANSIFSLGIYGTILFGYVLSGPILLLLGKPSTIILLVLLFFISTFFILLIKPPQKAKKIYDTEFHSTNSIGFSLVHETREIFSFVKKAKKVMHALVVLTIAQAVIFMFAVLGPGYLSTVLDVEIESLSWILIAPAALGMGFGALILGTFGKKFEPKWLSMMGFMISGVTFILFPLGNKVASRDFIQNVNLYLPHSFTINTLHIVVALAFITGFAISLVFIPLNATIQMESNEAIRGRIYGLLNALIGAVSFLPVVLAGSLADLFGIPVVITGVGLMMLAISIFFLFFS